MTRGIQLIEFPVVGFTDSAPFFFRPFQPQNPLFRRKRSFWEAGENSGTRVATYSVSRPVVLLQTGGEPVIVDGHRRMDAARRAGAPAVSALLLPAKIDRVSVVSFALDDGAENLSGVERLVAVRKTARYVRFGIRDEAPVAPADESPEVAERLLPLYSRLFSRQVDREYLRRVDSVLSFPYEELALLHALEVPVERLAPFLDLTADERKGLLLLLSRFHATASETRSLIRLILELRGPSSRPGRVDVPRWFAEKACFYTPESRAKQLVVELKAILSPTLTRRREAIEETIRALGLEPSVVLRPPENLEGDAFSCYFKFSSVEEIKNHLRTLRRAIDDGTIETLLRELNDV